MSNIETITIEDKFIGIDELVDSYIAGKIMGLKPRTIRDMGVKRTLPIYKIGARSNRYLVRDLIEYCEERRSSIQTPTN